jgi:hypothetical protein
MLSAKERERLKLVREMLAKDENPYEGIKGMDNKSMNVKPPVEAKEKPLDEALVSKWNWREIENLEYLRIKRGKLVLSGPIKDLNAPEGETGLKCLICDCPIQFTTSTPGEVRKGSMKIEGLKKVGHRIMETEAYIGLYRKGRACDDCKPKLARILHEERAD